MLKLELICALALTGEHTLRAKGHFRLRSLRRRGGCDSFYVLDQLSSSWPANAARRLLARIPPLCFVVAPTAEVYTYTVHLNNTHSHTTHRTRTELYYYMVDKCRVNDVSCE